MSLQIFFNSIKDTLYKSVKAKDCFYHHITVYTENFPDWKTADIALFGIEEDRGNPDNKGAAKGPDKVREALYKLKKGHGAYKVVDLGNIRKGATIEESLKRLKEVCQTLLESNTLPFIVGGTHDLDVAQYQAYEIFGDMVNVVNVDAFVDFTEDETLPPAQRHLKDVLFHQPNYLFNFSQLGHQSYLVGQPMLDVMDKLNFDAYRVGQVRESITDIEPIIRSGNMLSFDITAIKAVDAPGNNNAQQFGLTGEEACQLCWYAGQNTTLSSIGIYEYNPAKDDNNRTAFVIATMAWYFIEGYYNRKDTLDFTGSQYTKFVVTLDEAPRKLVFYKNKNTQTWWMEIVYTDTVSKKEKTTVAPCSYKDYQTAMGGEPPERWIKIHNKLI